MPLCDLTVALKCFPRHGMLCFVEPLAQPFCQRQLGGVDIIPAVDRRQDRTKFTLCIPLGTMHGPCLGDAPAGYCIDR